MDCILTVDDGTRQLLPPVYIFTTPVQSTMLPIQRHLVLVCLPSSHGEVTVCTPPSTVVYVTDPFSNTGAFVQRSL